MPEFTYTLSDQEWEILNKHLEDPQRWLEDMILAKIKKATKAVAKEAMKTGKIGVEDEARIVAELKSRGKLMRTYEEWDWDILTDIAASSEVPYKRDTIPTVPR